MGCLHSPASGHTDLKCILSTHTLNTTAPKNKSQPRCCLTGKSARITEQEEKLRMETRADLPNSTQRELPNFHKLHTQRGGGKSLCSPTGKAHSWGCKVTAAPESSRNPHGEHIHGLEFHTWLRSVSFWARVSEFSLIFRDTEAPQTLLSSTRIWNIFQPFLLDRKMVGAGGLEALEPFGFISLRQCPVHLNPGPL